MKLSKAQTSALKTLDSWRKGMQITTARLRHDGVTLAVLRSLEHLDMVDSERASNGIFWRLNEAGRLALRKEAPDA